ncbi:MAG TPA: hypothetical protein VFZ78_08330, partial [Flavisolibacter sp.]
MRSINHTLGLQCKVALFLLLLSVASLPAAAQYFGRNKVVYEKFDFKVTQSPHFDLYNYLRDTEDKQWFSQVTEQWYSMHQRVLRDTFKQRNPFILYLHHAHFQQTRAIGGQIDVGTGGVTEALKNRVIMPLFEANAQTDHVLGHELVHAFQYHLVQDSFSLNALNNLPLWMVEGMAEYMSIGHIDPNTAMWLRSAVQNDKLPTLKDLTNRPDLYFPYRWGEAFWAYVTGRYGDTVIRRLFLETARRGYADAIRTVFKVDEKQFSQQWQEAIRSAFAPMQPGMQSAPTGRALLHQKNAGDLNIIPSFSPDGRYVAFWTEKNLFSLDLYIADAETGRSVERITKTSLGAHVDQYSSFESAVAWAPDSRRIAFVAFAKGRNRLLIANTSGKIQEEIDLPGITGFSNPVWSPDGNTIVVTGMNEGQSDLFAYNLQTRAMRQLTNDIYSDLMPSFSPDGKTLVFATDRMSIGNTRVKHVFTHNLALLDMASGSVTNLDVFPGANNLNPVFGKDNNLVYFLSDRDGFRNMYSYNRDSRQILQLTKLFTGISG